MVWFTDGSRFVLGTFYMLLLIAALGKTKLALDRNVNVGYAVVSLAFALSCPDSEPTHCFCRFYQSIFVSRSFH